LHASRTLLAAVLITLAASPIVTVQAATTESATLSFRSSAETLAGSFYGITAVDEQAQVFGARGNVEVAAGRRTISYACPIGPQSTLTQDFAAGGNYELICSPGQLAQIKAIDDC
jgi:hypothetical protein